MPSIDVTRSFPTQSYTLADYFVRPGAAFYIPLYQRDYSWDSDNIEQLMEDVFRGVNALLDSSSRSNSIRFLGTIITVTESHPHQNIHPKDVAALPPRIDKVIDGQQRLSTIALLATVLFEKITRLSYSLPRDGLLRGLAEAAESYRASLLEMFTLDLRRGDPPLKPIIIRGAVDQWTLTRSEDSYKSDVASHLAKCIQIYKSVGLGEEAKLNFPKGDRETLVGKNIRLMHELLRTVEQAHQHPDGSFPGVWEIIRGMSESDLWLYSRPELKEYIKSLDGERLTKEQHLVCSLVQLFAFSHYLLRRCCFTVIEPADESWAFDMFQSLNATGTPLTSLETFKPLVVNMADQWDGGYKDSDFDREFQHIDALMRGKQTASAKSKMTDTFLTTFALSYDGEKLSSQFSDQRNWLVRSYPDGQDKTQDRVIFIRQMGNMARYWEAVENVGQKAGYIFPGLETLAEKDRKESSLAFLYLQEAGHKMAHTVLSRFYSGLLAGDHSGNFNFANAVRALAAFFTIWRSAKSNSGLDHAYRRLLKDHLSWAKLAGTPSAHQLCEYLWNILCAESIGTFDTWVLRAQTNLSYGNAPNAVCKFALFVAAHDTIADPNNPGLMKESTQGYSIYLEPEKWISDDLKSIEHIAPQKPLSADASWPPELYKDDAINRIGNLTLLPIPINSSASNRPWLEKWYYYRHLAQGDPNEQRSILNEAEKDGVALSQPTLEKLQSARYHRHIEPIVKIGKSGWNREVVENRTKRICELLWNRMSAWLGVSMNQSAEGVVI